MEIARMLFARTFFNEESHLKQVFIHISHENH